MALSKGPGIDDGFTIAISYLINVGQRNHEGSLMSQRIHRSRKEKRREGLTWDERWKGDDKGLIACWEVGREIREQKPDLAIRAENGELVVLGWKGGVEEKTKIGEKYGTLFYLAQWQGVRGDDLDIDLAEETELTCSRTGMRVTYTGDLAKYGSV